MRLCVRLELMMYVTEHVKERVCLLLLSANDVWVKLHYNDCDIIPIHAG